MNKFKITLKTLFLTTNTMLVDGVDGEMEICMNVKDRKNKAEQICFFGLLSELPSSTLSTPYAQVPKTVVKMCFSVLQVSNCRQVP